MESTRQRLAKAHQILLARLGLVANLVCNFKLARRLRSIIVFASTAVFARRVNIELVVVTESWTRFAVRALAAVHSSNTFLEHVISQIIMSAPAAIRHGFPAMGQLI